MTTTQSSAVEDDAWSSSGAVVDVGVGSTDAVEFRAREEALVIGGAVAISMSISISPGVEPVRVVITAEAAGAMETWDAVAGWGIRDGC